MEVVKENRKCGCKSVIVQNQACTIGLRQVSKDKW